jgi:hypothetical protein
VLLYATRRAAVSVDGSETRAAGVWRRPVQERGGVQVAQVAAIDPVEDADVGNLRVYVDTLGVPATDFGLTAQIGALFLDNGRTAPTAFPAKWRRDTTRLQHQPSRDRQRDLQLRRPRGVPEARGDSPG